MFLCSKARRFFVDFAKSVVVDVKVRRHVREGWQGVWRGIVRMRPQLGCRLVI